MTERQVEKVDEVEMGQQLGSRSRRQNRTTSSVARLFRPCAIGACTMVGHIVTCIIGVPLITAIFSSAAQEIGTMVGRTLSSVEVAGQMNAISGAAGYIMPPLVAYAVYRAWRSDARGVGANKEVRRWNVGAAILSAAMVMPISPAYQPIQQTIIEPLKYQLLQSPVGGWLPRPVLRAMGLC